ncbi:hypothetical protein Tco_0260243 [Tanacetum coccineum]
MTDKVVVIKEKLKAARDRQKSYANNRRKPLEFEVGDRVMLKVSPWKGVVHFRKKAYRLRLSEELSGVHDTFHVSNLKKCLADASMHVPLDEIKVDKTLRFVEEPVEIMEREIKSLKRSKISLVKVRWNSKRGPEFTWEREDYMKSNYPQLFFDRAGESANLLPNFTKVQVAFPSLILSLHSAPVREPRNCNGNLDKLPCAHFPAREHECDTSVGFGEAPEFRNHLEDVEVRKSGYLHVPCSSTVPTSNPYDLLSQEFDPENYTMSRRDMDASDDMESVEEVEVVFDELLI